MYMICVVILSQKEYKKVFSSLIGLSFSRMECAKTCLSDWLLNLSPTFIKMIIYILVNSIFVKRKKELLQHILVTVCEPLKH